MKKLTYFLAAALAVFALSSCGSGGQGAESNDAHEHESEHVHEDHAHAGHAHEAHTHEAHAHEAHTHEAHAGHAHNHDTHGHESETHAPGIIEFSPEQAEAAGLLTETVKAGPFSQATKVSGEILPAQGDETTIVATTAGILTFSNGLTAKTSAILPGAAVRAGSALAWISARNISDGDPALITRAALDAAAKEYERAKALIESGAISRKEYEQAELAYINAQAAYKPYEGRTAEAGVAVKTGLTGYIKEIYVNEGDYVNAGQPLFTITQNRRLQLRADVPQKHYAALRNLSGANFRPSYSDETYSIKALGGRLVSTGRSSGGTFYIPAIFEFANTGDFVPGSYSDIYLIGAAEEGIFSVPETALLEEQGVYSVFIKICDEEYRKQEVHIGRTDGIRREILSGLSEGDEVVTSGTGQVRLASMSGVIPEGHSHNH